MQEVQITPILISTVAGSLLSLVLFVLEIFSPRFDNLPDNKKQGINVLLILVVTVGIALLSCFSEIVFIACTQLGLFELATMMMSAMIGNAGTYVSLNKVADATKEQVR